VSEAGFFSRPSTVKEPRFAHARGSDSIQSKSLTPTNEYPETADSIRIGGVHMAMGWFRCVAEAIAHKGLHGLLQEVPGMGWLYDVASDAYRRLHERRQDEHLRVADRQECEQSAKANQTDIDAQMAQLADCVIIDDTSCKITEKSLFVGDLGFLAWSLGGVGVAVPIA